MALIGTARHILSPKPEYIAATPPSRQSCLGGDTAVDA